jgi:hypothetical protein
MSSVTVYRFRRSYDINSDELNIQSPRKMAARETIRGLGREFQVIEGTGVEIDSARLDGNGMIDAKSASS